MHFTHSYGKVTTMNFLSPQEQEEADFHPQSEFSMCLEEAQIRVADLSTECPVVGKGAYMLTVSGPYYCRATDAFAGWVPFHKERFGTLGEAEKVADGWYATLEAKYEELRIEVSHDGVPVSYPVPPVPSAPVIPDDCPF